jgi:hypothetical protein
MNPYYSALQRINQMDDRDPEARKELKEIREGRDEARQKASEDQGMKLPYTSRPDFIGERWK